MDAAFDTRESGLGADPSTVLEVLVVRPGGLGEMVKAVPALRHLRTVYPAARITVMASRPALELVRACPYVDRCIAVAERKRAVGSTARRALVAPATDAQ